MDHWGDPWADTDDTTNDADSKLKSPPKSEVAPPTPPSTLPSANVYLNGFEDDAQWGSTEQEEEWGGGWAAEPKHHVAETPVVKTEEPSSATIIDAGTGGWDAHSDAGENPLEPAHSGLDTPGASDSGSTVQLDDDHAEQSTPYPEDNLSTRSSTSRSNTSHTELPTESPRTSIEEDRSAGKVVEVVEPLAPNSDDAAEVTASDSTATEVQQEKELNTPEDGESPFGEPVETPLPSISVPAVDQSVWTQLFPPSEPSEEAEPPYDDPIHSTAARKAWYRLTRKQTMREFNTGGNDNNYVRVTWANSHVRLNVGKVVSRWAAEDRLSGRGAAGRHSFYWDQPVNFAEKKIGAHMRTASTPVASAAARPLEKRIQPIATDVPAAFDWSSPSAAQDDPWKSESLSNLPAPSEQSADPPAATFAQQPVPVEPVPRVTYKPKHRKTMSLISPIPEAPSPISIDSALNPSASARPQPTLSPIDTKPNLPTPDTATNDDDDDDDWSEMIQSPSISTTPMELFPDIQTTSAVLPAPPAPPTTPKWAKSSPFHAAASRDASPIVRLQGTVSPMSAVLRVDKYVPPSVEQGPIGPSVLRKKSSQLTLEKTHGSPAVVDKSGDIFGNMVEEAGPKSDSADERSAVASTTTAESSTQKTSAAIKAPEPDFPVFSQEAPANSTDPWLNADFSIFESAAPPLSTPPPSPTKQLSTHTRSSTIHTSAPPSMPPTGATQPAQHRKAEGDEIIKSILDSLPDLGYMLQP